MICPKCNVEYRVGFTECSDCKVDLVEKQHEKVRIKHTKEGISLIKYGIGLLFLSTLEIMVAIIAYEFYWVYKLSNGGVSGTAFTNIHPAIWFLTALEILISLAVIVWGSTMTYKETRKSN